jgi:hypothetical protein
MYVLSDRQWKYDCACTTSKYRCHTERLTSFAFHLPIRPFVALFFSISFLHASIHFFQGSHMFLSLGLVQFGKIPQRIQYDSTNIYTVCMVQILSIKWVETSTKLILGFIPWASNLWLKSNSRLLWAAYLGEMWLLNFCYCCCYSTFD